MVKLIVFRTLSCKFCFICVHPFSLPLINDTQFNIRPMMWQSLYRQRCAQLLIMSENIDKLYSVGIVLVFSVAALQTLNSFSPHPTSSSIAPLNYMVVPLIV